MSQNFENQSQENALLLKANYELQIKMEEKEKEFQNREKNIEEQKAHLDEKNKDFNEREKKFELECQKQKQINKAVEQNLELKKAESEKLARETWSKIHKHSDFEQQQYIKIMKSYKDELDLNNLIIKLDAMRSEEIKRSREWETEREDLTCILNEFKRKIMELESQLEEGNKEKRKFEGENEKLRENNESLTKQVVEMNNSVVNTATDDGNSSGLSYRFIKKIFG